MNFFLKSLKEHRLQDDVNNKIIHIDATKSFKRFLEFSKEKYMYGTKDVLTPLQVMIKLYF